MNYSILLLRNFHKIGIIDTIYLRAIFVDSP